MKKTIFLVMVLSIQFSALAQESEETSNAAANATNPLAFVTKLQMQPNFTWKDDDARQINFTMRLIQPAKNIGLPFIKSKNPAEWYTIYRLEVPIIGQTFPNSPEMDATGLSDLILLDVIVKKQKWGLVGLGPGIIIPTMNPSQISGRKWGVGPTTVVLVTKTKGIQYGVLAQQYFTFAGDEERPDQSYMIFQPIFNKIFSKGYFIQFAPLWNFNWTNSTYNLPISLSFGKAFSKGLSAFIAPEYVVTGPHKNDFTLRFQLNAMF